jgi:Zn-dependent protease with chaperone function
MSSHLESSLEAGLSAVKQGDHQTAIAILEVVAVKEQSTPSGVQAEIGLVVAYARSGNIPGAIALCETLTQSNNLQVRDWAVRTLIPLTIHRPSASTLVLDNGFVPFNNSLLTSDPVNFISPKELDNAVAPTSELGSAIVQVSREQSKPHKINWRQAPRAKVWQPLPKKSKFDLIPLQLLAFGTFIALFWVMRELLELVFAFINDILVKLPFLEPIQLLYRDTTPWLLVLLFILMGVSPWLLDWVFANFYGQREIDRDGLNLYSHEAVRVLHRYSHQRGWKFPKLRILPIAAPLAITYGNLPRNARIVVSQGLLEQLADDEIAAIYATQLGHIRHWNFVVMSVLLLVTIPVYRLYLILSNWADGISLGFGRMLVGMTANLFYIVWCLLTGTALLNSQVRNYYSDRFTCDLTGNPNGLVRALLKIAIGIAGDIEKQQQTTWQLESLNIVAPVGYQQSLSMGSIAPNVSFESLLIWDYLNPYSRWFTINNTHPMIGDRVYRLCQIARSWHIEPEIYIDLQQPLRVKRQSFLLQIAPFVGIPLGISFAALIWLVWHLAFALKILNLKWIYEDWSFITGCLFIGFSIGTLMRINSFFPQIKAQEVETEERLPNLCANPSALPIDCISVRLVGKLLGRCGTSNLLGQDLILHCNTGLIKLHHISWAGQSLNIQDFIGRQVSVTGWFRRSATPWVDIQTLQTQSGKTINSPHPIWSTVLAVATEAWGAYILLRG